MEPPQETGGGGAAPSPLASLPPDHPPPPQQQRASEEAGAAAAAATPIPIRALPFCPPQPPPKPPSPPRPPVPTRRPAPPPPPPQHTAPPPNNPFDTDDSTTTTTITRRHPLHHRPPHHRLRPPAGAILGWTQAPRNPFDETVTLDRDDDGTPAPAAAAGMAAPWTATATISAALLRKQRSVMPVEIFGGSMCLNRALASSSARPVSSGDKSPRPFDEGDEETGANASAASFRFESGGGGAGGPAAAAAAAVVVVKEEEEEEEESIDPALARSYDARQVLYNAIRDAVLLYIHEIEVRRPFPRTHTPNHDTTLAYMKRDHSSIINSYSKPPHPEPTKLRSGSTSPARTTASTRPSSGRRSRPNTRYVCARVQQEG